MIHLLDRALRTLVRRVPELGHESQIRFQPPDDQWRAAVANLQVDGAPAPSLNVYLTELRQNRQWRSNRRDRSISDGTVVERLAPGWVECQYLMSAWSPAVSEQVEPALDEHELLYAVAAVLQDGGPITPSRILPAGSADLAAWGDYQDAELPTELLPLEGFPKLAEFWGTMGAGNRWKPVLQLHVGLPLIRTAPVLRGPPVVTVELAVHGLDDPDVRDVRVRIAGRVLLADGTAATGVAVTVAVVTPGGEPVRATTADPDTARFDLDLPLDAVTAPAGYRLRAVAGTASGESALDWRAPSHDVTLTASAP